jgi:hypothetical protein
MMMAHRHNASALKHRFDRIDESWPMQGIAGFFGIENKHVTAPI